MTFSQTGRTVDVSSSEYRNVIYPVHALVRDDVSTASVDVSRGAVPLFLSMCLVIFHVESKSVEY